MPGKRHMRYDNCKHCGGCDAGQLRCRHGHIFCWCRIERTPQLLRIPDSKGGGYGY